MYEQPSKRRITLRVTPAQVSTADLCGMASMHSHDMDHLSQRSNALLRIKGTLSTAIRLAEPSDAIAAGEIALTALQRANAGVVVGDSIDVEEVAATVAHSVTLVSLAERSYTEQAVGNWLQRQWRRLASEPKPKPIAAKEIVGLPLVAQDCIEIISAGARRLYRVLATVPDAVVVPDANTQIEVLAELEQMDNSAAYDQVGGLSNEVARVREMVELPMRHPQVFHHLGIDPPRGLLLYGPPGCGKTLIARAVARESGAHFIHINGPEIIQKHYGESEEVLRNLFAEAQRYEPSVLFFDEIDALAPNRETVLGDVEKRVVAQLLALMDGLHDRGRIFVLAATNLPNSIDPALRRPGRFDREIAINPPDKSGRLEILKIHSRNMPLASDVDLESIAARTHGFLGADLAALCREAAMCCARDLKRGFHNDYLDAVNARVALKHFDVALGEFDLSTTRQVSTEMAEARWAQIGGLHKARRVLQESVEWPLKYPERFAMAGATPARGILLTGSPGTGKTLLARAIATESEVNFISVKGPELLSKWVGESERGIREVFRRARQSAPSILFFDEIDAIAPRRGEESGAAKIGDRMVGQILLEMDNLENQPGVVVMAATNRPESLDSALLRPGRFEVIVQLELPNLEERLEILQIHTRAIPLDDSVDLAALAAETDGMNGADLQSICRRAAMAAIADSVAADPGRHFQPFTVTGKQIAEATREVRKIALVKP